ncbi:uncharacterized protein LOC142334930 [Convolutriloba macropyga]|uniref:uncharacterized protein LOC142334930 n=1 Tax=Convolutriloba macropyga TaxID=536237 RepID=UPI003F51F4DF
MSEAFEAAAVIVKAVTKIAEWLANAIEGDDDVYIQHTNKDQQAADHVAIIPPGGGVMKMNDGDSVTFMERFGEYSRIALDKGAQSIEIRERDNAGHDTSLGAFTLGMDQCNTWINKGGVGRPLDTFYDNRNGEGCIYHIMFSFANEDWTLPPNQE